MLQPDPGSSTVDLLYQISQQIAGITNGTQLPASALLPPPGQIPFSPGFAAIATNILWFISLGLSLACAVTATLVQQWAQNYVHAIERRPVAERRARMRMYLFEGVERFKMIQLVDGVPALLHLALFSFLLGLIFFIQPISTPVTIVSIAILVTCVVVYLFATFLPLVAFNAPIQTPLTSVVWQKRVIRTFYWTCAHILLVMGGLQLLMEPVRAASEAMFAALGVLWTALDLLIREMGSAFEPTVFNLLTSCLGDLRGPRTLEILRERRSDLVAQWSPWDLEIHTLDTIRTFVAHDKTNASFQWREMLAFAWLTESLDENELLPFLEAVPTFIQTSDPELGSYDPQDTLSFMVLETLSLHDQIAYKRLNVRVRFAVADFYLCLRWNDWMQLKVLLSPMSACKLIYRTCLPFTEPPELQLREQCLQGIMKSCWKDSMATRVEENPVWPVDFLSLWRDLQQASMPTDDIHPYLTFAEAVLNNVHLLTSSNCEPFVTFLDIMRDCFSFSQPPLLVHSRYECSQYAKELPKDQQPLVCAMITLLISAFDSESDMRFQVVWEVDSGISSIF